MKLKYIRCSCPFLLGGLILTAFPYAFALTANAQAVSEMSTLQQEESFKQRQLARVPDANVETYLLLNLSERQVSVRQDGEVITTYPVAVGRPGWETPTGEFEVKQMVKNPSWQNPWTDEIISPGEDNPLGKRWIGFWTNGENDIGFHGTPDESVMGDAVSHGCVRMRNDDISEMFEKISVGDKVIVKE